MNEEERMMEVTKMIFTDEFSLLNSYLLEKVSETDMEQFILKMSKTFKNNKLPIFIVGISYILTDIFTSNDNTYQLLKQSRETIDKHTNKFNPSYI